MLKVRPILLSAAFLLLTGLNACRKEKPMGASMQSRPVLPATDYDYTSDDLPPYLGFFSTISHPITNSGAKLGRVLFYDKALSLDHSISCGSCHQQAKAFSDPRKFSTGITGHHTGRHSMAVFNTRYASRFFWDRRAHFIEEQVLMPIQNPNEMGISLDGLVNRLKTINYYPALFLEAFGTTEITPERISIALGMFVQSIVSYRSKFDAGYSNDFANFTPLEKDGMDLFNSGIFNCNNCHGFGGFTASDPLNNGLDSVFTDPGVGGITGNASDIGKFKIASLRNVELSAPYMHDGRFGTLEEVIEHYNSGIMPSPTLDDRLTTTNFTGGPPKRYHMTAYQKQALIAFLKTLTDHELVKDVRWSDPFR